MVWTKTDAEAYRAEVERRFRERTPPKCISDASVADRVGRGEMRNWCKDNLGKEAPELDEAWLADQAVWYRTMAKRVVKELDPQALPRTLQAFRRTRGQKDTLRELRDLAGGDHSWKE